ncbi:MAG: RNA-binding transcriptional accessory protein [Tannerellaceae bacterium]|jgi:uncharacterized protein|nr:RNA-binding transcriptional accessory protein [Tannerellaceae bacterium]
MTTTTTVFYSLIANSVDLPVRQVGHTVELLREGATIPFISRYRKEMTGGLDEVQVGHISDRLNKFTEIAGRKDVILASIAEQGLLTDSIRQRIEASWDSRVLEDIYLPYKPKRVTRAELARRRGLEPLAGRLWRQGEGDLGESVRDFLGGEVASERDALQGARDILAEWVSESEEARRMVRQAFERGAVISSGVVKGKEEEGAKYRDYFNFSEPLKRCSSHRLLALRRGESEGILRVRISPDAERCLAGLKQHFVTGRNVFSEQVSEAVEDAFKRLLCPGIETEYAALSKGRADREAIRVFADNLRQLLLAPPLGRKRVLGIDPGYRSGCKLVCLDAQGDLLHNETIYPHPPRNERIEAAARVAHLVSSYALDAIAVGNATGGRETEEFIRGMRLGGSVRIFMVSESGASVYSASALAREEFPDLDLTVRSAVSIGRRLMDPLAELVKIDPESMGVGQYQHDVDRGLLRRSLEQTVESCVNAVGVDVNTAGKHLLTYVSGLGPALARNIVDYRSANGPFRNRRELLRVPRLGKKSFEQCAGFLRIPHGENPLDNSAVHPESYWVAEALARDLGCPLSELVGRKLAVRPDLSKYVTGDRGMPTLLDVLEELERPGRDPRRGIRVFAFDSLVRRMEDLRVGYVLPGVVTNVTNFGCFVDIGIKENGLVHISEMSEHFVADPRSLVSLGQVLRVRVLGVDLPRRRVLLSLKGV